MASSIVPMPPYMLGERPAPAHGGSGAPSFRQVPFVRASERVESGVKVRKQLRKYLKAASATQHMVAQTHLSDACLPALQPQEVAQSCFMEFFDQMRTYNQALGNKHMAASKAYLEMTKPLENSGKSRRWTRDVYNLVQRCVSDVQVAEKKMDKTRQRVARAADDLAHWKTVLAANEATYQVQPNNPEHDTRSTKHLMNMLQTFYRNTSKDRQEYLHTVLKDHGAWRVAAFWGDALLESVAEEISKTSPDTPWYFLPDPERSQKVLEVHNIVYGQVSAYLYHLSSFGFTRRQLLQYARNVCFAYELGEEQRISLLASVQGSTTASYVGSVRDLEEMKMIASTVVGEEGDESWENLFGASAAPASTASGGKEDTTTSLLGIGDDKSDDEKHKDRLMKRRKNARKFNDQLRLARSMPLSLRIHEEEEDEDPRLVGCYDIARLITFS
ncbi:hypothetical protein BBO99_00006502 [Phytophthora kernoviae]|uniref:SBF1/SBF2 domain-containing protein n=2 Tax=Phytophthora kernoviae TaxID=325452 RepID=A0A3R7KHT8_9STRA|nr:hypothetical protein G195_007242 [Phytophthora kernoviae 00238/432]KAG2522828.1 hypothetical protein JM16_003258 [Phytophthora kernoviae]KAG2524453.1 hypothetical protein JM18_002961 [Phytophthora kernoviae]RLN21624.1 hypothetical protein BBI17_003605 [Phytophthora kernoviae]RLN77757.1 hypothetical protein BBO99_00006502 [Phytophthora kernoviae]